MPKIHNPDWYNLKLSDFPHFKCLCELCDCGCFDRSKKKHTNQCKKFALKISDAFESNINKPSPFETSTLYTETFKKFDFKSNDSNFDNSSNHINLPYRHGPRGDNIELPDRDVRFTTHTTNKDHYKSWQAPPTKSIPEYPEFTSRLLYPNEKRDLLTTNETLFYKNYGKHKAESTGLNIFENTFKINQGKMNLDTVYTNDFHKINIKEYLKTRGPHMTKELVEGKNKQIIAHIPMETKTQKMIDFSYDPEEFQNVFKKNKEPYPIDAFRSKLRTGFKPIDNDASFNESNNNFSFREKNDENSRPASNSYQPSFADSNLTHNKNIRFITTLDNQLIPSLKVKKTMSKNSLSESRKYSHSSVEVGPSQDYSNEPSGSTYTVDFKDRGVNICMAKAYSMVANNLINTNS